MFLINWGEIKGRIDPFYYKIEYRTLEKTVLKNTKYKLRDFILYMAGGATPQKDQKEKYYADESGIPFIRVQNLTPEGLDLSYTFLYLQLTLLIHLYELSLHLNFKLIPASDPEVLNFIVL